MEDLVNLVIRRDTQALTGWDLAALPDAILNALEVTWFNDLVPFTVHENLKLVAENMKRTYKKYFYYSSKTKKDPIEIYENIKKNWEQIIKEFTEGLADDILDDPIGYHMRYYITEILHIIPVELPKIGYIHKFDADYIRENFFPEDGEEEES